MKFGIIIAAAIVLFLGTLGFLGYRGVPDQPSNITSAANLVQLTLPEGMPALVAPSEGTADAAARYAEVVAYYHANARALKGRNTPPSMVAELSALMDRAMQAGQMRQGYLDAQTPLTLTEVPEYEEAMDIVTACLWERFGELYETGNVQGAANILLSLFAYNQRAFQHNIRIEVRFPALMMMLELLNKLRGDGLHEQVPGGRPVIEQWLGALDKIGRVWEPKFQVLRTVQPNIGDVLNMAENDQDPGFRIAALLQLGRLKYSREGGTRGNTRAITRVLRDTQSSSDPLVKEAALWAEKFERDQVRKIR